MSEFYNLGIDKCVEDKRQFIDITLAIAGVTSSKPATVINAVLNDVNNEDYNKNSRVLHSLYSNSLVLYYELNNIKTDKLVTNRNVKKLCDVLNIELHYTEQFDSLIDRIYELVNLNSKDKDPKIVAILGFINAFYPRIKLNGLHIPVEYKEEANFLINNNSGVILKEFQRPSTAAFFSELNTVLIRDCLDKPQVDYFSYDQKIASIRRSSRIVKEHEKLGLVLKDIVNTEEYRRVRHSYKSMSTIISSMFSLTRTQVDIIGTMYLIYILHPRKLLNNFEALVNLWLLKEKEIKVVKGGYSLNV